MRELVYTWRMDYGLSVCVALDAAGIRYSTNDPTGEQGMRIFVPEEDYERARGLLPTVDVATTTGPAPFMDPLMKVCLTLLGLMFAAIIAIAVVRARQP